MASSKNFTEVLIGGKVFTLSGFESEEYLQKVSTYLNHKIDECSSSEGYRKQSAETRSVLLALNIADDYFKAKAQVEKLEQDIEMKDREIYNLKHDLISNQIKTESDEKTLTELQAENKELLLSKAKLEAANKELLLNKTKLEASLEDALLGKVPGAKKHGEEKIANKVVLFRGRFYRAFFLIVNVQV